MGQDGYKQTGMGDSDDILVAGRGGDELVYGVYPRQSLHQTSYRAHGRMILRIIGVNPGCGGWGRDPEILG